MNASEAYLSWFRRVFGDSSVVAMAIDELLLRSPELELQVAIELQAFGKDCGDAAVAMYEFHQERET